MQRLTHNLGLKLLSLVLAILLWSHVRGEVNPLETMTVDVPLRVKAPDGWRLAGEVPAKVTLLLQGPRVSLRNIKGGALANPLMPTDQAPNIVEGALSASLPELRPRAGTQKVTVQAESHVVDVEVLRASPAEIPVTLEPRADSH